MILCSLATSNYYSSIADIIHIYGDFSARNPISKAMILRVPLLEVDVLIRVRLRDANDQAVNSPLLQFRSCRSSVIHSNALN